MYMAPRPGGLCGEASLNGPFSLYVLGIELWRLSSRNSTCTEVLRKRFFGCLTGDQIHGWFWGKVWNGVCSGRQARLGSPTL